MSQKRSPKFVLRSFLVALWLLFAAFLAVAVIPAPWEGLGGRDFRPQCATLAVLLLVSGIAVRYLLHWPWSSIVLGLAAVELLALFIIGSFSGATGPDLFSSFNLEWLGFISLFVAAPWLAGAGIGDAFRLLKARSVAAN